MSLCSHVYITLKQGCHSQIDGGPNTKFSYKLRAGLMECSLKNFKMMAYSVVNQIEAIENLTNILQHDQINKTIFS